MELRWIILLVIILMIIILLWPDPASGAYWGQVETPAATPGETVPSLPAATLIETARPLPSATPIPAEYLETSDQTSGIICGSIVLVLIIVGGTFGVLRRKSSLPHK